METLAPHSPLPIGIISYAHTAHAISYSSSLMKSEQAVLAGIYDEDPARGRQFSEQFGVPFYPRLESLLAREEIQAVIVCSPTDQHRDQVCAAAQAGKHVLCEKPISITLEQAADMIAACAAAGVRLQIPFVCRFYPMMATAQALVASGALGRLVGCVGGNRGVPPLPPVYPGWITDPVQAGGGALLDHSVHVTDALRFLTSAEVETVFAEQSIFSERSLAVEDCGLLALTFENGLVASVDPSWSIPENNPYRYDFYLRLLGEKGTLNLDDTRQALVVVSDQLNHRPVNHEPFGVDVDTAMVEHFIRCVRANQNLFPAATGVDGLRALEIALAAYASIRERRPVSLPLERTLL